jgi:uncharacterized protein (TIGR00106 family)
VKHIVNISLQILPTSKDKNVYEIVDKAIEVIQKSGIKYKVCPFETVMEGNYDKIMEIIKEVHIACLNYGAEHIFANIKMQIMRNENVLIDDKIEKYENKKRSK